MDKFTVIDKIINILGAVTLAVMLFASAMNIFSAWITGRRYGQAEELVLACFVWVTYVGIGSLYKHGEQIQVDFLVQMLPDRVRRFIMVFRDFVVFGCSIIVVYYVIRLMMRAAQRGMRTATLRISYVLIDLSVLLGFLYIILDLMAKFLCVIRKYKPCGARKGDE